MSGSAENQEAPPAPDWQRYFSSERLPNRSEIDPQKKLQGEGLWEKIDNWMQAHQKNLGAGEPYLITEEYIDLLEPNIRPAAQAINRLGYAKTYASCEGHPISHEEYGKEAHITADGVTQFPDLPTDITPEGRLQYHEPYLMILVDKNNPKTEQLLRGVENMGRDFVRQYPDAHIHGAHTPVDQNVSRVKFEINITVPDTWIKANHRRDPEILRKDTALAGASQPDSKNNESELQRRYIQEYGDYFETAECRKMIQEFFQRIARVAEALPP